MIPSGILVLKIFLPQAIFTSISDFAVATVNEMSAAEKLRAVQLWNVLSEKLQEIVNNSAADINALAFQEPTICSNTSVVQPQANNYSSGYTYPVQDKAEDSCDFTSNLRKSSVPSIEADNSLASFSDIQCADEEDMDDVCPLTLPLTVEGAADSSADREKDKNKVFECSECRVTFRTRGHLLDHSRKHTGERPFLCSDCGSTFTTASNLKRHIKSHTGTKNFSCHECQARFLEKKTLLVHMRRHTGEKPYQ